MEVRKGKGKKGRSKNKWQKVTKARKIDKKQEEELRTKQEKSYWPLS